MGTPDTTSFTAGSNTNDNGSTPGEFRASSVLSSMRFKEMNARENYFLCRQHDHKEWSFDGRRMTQMGPGALATQSLLNAQVAPSYIPLAARRPDSPYRLPRAIVWAFTNMLFGEQRFPGLSVEGDPDGQDFATELVNATHLRQKMIRARNVGGSVGTVGLSWCYDRRGKPKVEVHNGKWLYVHAWDDREELIPRHVTKVFFEKKSDVWDPQKKKFVVQWYWHRRDWTENEEIYFHPVLFEKGREPTWVPDPQNSHDHNDGFCHFVWVQNEPTDDEDGLPDYEGEYEKFDKLDQLNSILDKGGIKNLDPTLVLGVDPDVLDRANVSKGSDNALAVGEAGHAEYLELTGTAIEAGEKLFNLDRRGVLEACSCVIPDPADAIGADISSVAQKQKYAPMVGKCEVYRDMYGEAMKRLLDQMLEVARVKTNAPITVYERNEETGEDEPKTVQYFVNVSPKVVKTPVVDETGSPAMGDDGKPQEQVQFVPRSPGFGGEVKLVWPAYFPPTSADKAQEVTAASTAAGGKAVLSQKTAVQYMAGIYGTEPDQEWEEVQKQNTTDQAAAQAQASAFGASGDDAGGKVGGEKGQPPGAKPFGGSKPPFGGGGGKPPGDDGEGSDGVPPDLS